MWSERSRLKNGRLGGVVRRRRVASNLPASRGFRHSIHAASALFDDFDSFLYGTDFSKSGARIYSLNGDVKYFIICDGKKVRRFSCQRRANTYRREIKLLKTNSLICVIE